MKKRILSLLLVLLLVCSLLPAGVHVNADEVSVHAAKSAPTLYELGDIEMEESEPNDSRESANSLPLGYTVNGTLEGTNEDYFVIEVEEDCILNFSSMYMFGELSTDMYASGSDEWLDYGGAGGNDDEESGITYYYKSYEVTAGTYYLQVWSRYDEDMEYSICLEIYEEHDHVYESSVVEPGCETDGYTLHTCSCGENYATDWVDPLGHDWDDGVVTKEATEDENGEITYTCQTCGDTQVEEFAYIARIFGAGRCETAIEVAEMMKETLGVDTFDAIIIANGDNFADALAGSYLAVQKSAPILLHRASAITMNREYIQENLSEGGIVYLLGGTAAVPAEVENDLKDVGITVKRLAGDTRFDTNLAILEEAGVEDKQILVCTGYDFADSLSASATGLPILLVNNGTGVLTDTQIAFLENLGGNELCIVGGPNAVSEELQAVMNEYVYTDRMWGATREWTSEIVAEYIYIRDGVSQDTVVLAYSRNYPDGLCGGPLAYMMGAPMLLVNAGAEEAAAEYVSKWDIEKGLILGGTSVISDEIVNTVFGMN